MADSDPHNLAAIQPKTENWAESPAGAAIAGGIIAAEVSPINEALRFGALGIALKVTGDPVLAAGAMAGTTLLVEGVAGVAAADLLATRNASKAVDKVHGWLGRKSHGAVPETNLVTELGIANFTGSAIMTGLKHAQDPTRTREENRKYGITMASYMAGFSGVLGYLTAEGITAPSPTTIGLGAIAIGGAYGAYKMGKKKFIERQQMSFESVNHGESPQRLGLSTEDKDRVLGDERTLAIEVNGKKEPVLVPIDQLYWYNHAYLKEHFETDEVYYYAHPDITGKKKDEAYNLIGQYIQDGAVILYDTVDSNGKVFGDLDHELQGTAIEYRRLPITKDSRQRFLYQYDGKFILNDDKEAPFIMAPGIFETYQQAVEEGTLPFDPNNGPALAEVIDGEEAERLWNIYHKPFERLSDSHPINSGYDKDGFLEILRDPEAVKAVYREDGVITTLALFLNDIKHCDWLDPSYYESHYPDAVRTGNHFIFPGIVTDELKRGASFSLPLIQLIAKTQALRKTPAVISFECTDKSYRYIPRIVRFAINRSGAAKTTGFENPVSRFDYYAISK